MTTATTAPARHDDAPPPRSGVHTSTPIDLDATYRAVRPDILQMAARRGFGEAEREEIAQSVGERLVTRSDAYDAAKGTRIQWAIGIAKNVLREAQRARRARHRFLAEEARQALESRPSGDLTPEERARARAALRLAEEAWSALTEQQRRIYELTMDGLTAKQVAAMLGIPDTTVELRIKQARAKIAGVLKRHQEDVESIKRVRGTVVPLATAAGAEHASRAPLAGRLARLGARASLPGAARGVGATAVFLGGFLAGVAFFAAFVGPGCGASRGGVAGPGPAPAVTVAATGSLAAAATVSATSAAAAAATVSATSAPAAPGTMPAARVAAPAVSAALAGAFDPETASESLLLQMALTAPPALALDYAAIHQKRFGSRSAGKRGTILIRALVALGRRGEAEAHARALKGTIYEKSIEDALGAPLR